MPLSEYRIKEFLGLDQSTEQSAIDPGASPDACNMDTSDGGLRVGAGFVRHINTPVPGSGPIRRLFVWKGLSSTRYIVFTGNVVYALLDTDTDPAWKEIYAFPADFRGLRIHIVQAQINSVDYLLFATGEHQMVKWDGVNDATLFGSAAKQSDIPVNYLAMHYGRLFAAGNPEYPNRLYWSQLPGDSRNIESFAVDEASENTGGGHVEVGDNAGDPITGMCALSNQLLLFKRRSIYRLLGDRPGNYRVYRVNAEVEQMQNAACVPYGDVPFWMTGGGLYYFDGQAALRTRMARSIAGFLRGADFANCRAGKRADRLYFTAYEPARDPSEANSARIEDNAIIVYDIDRQTYMVRRGFSVADLFSLDGTLYMVNRNRVIYRFDEGADYDGMPIDAYWQTPLTDLQQKTGIKTLEELFLRGVGEDTDVEGSVALIEARIGDNLQSYRYLMPQSPAEVLEIPLKNEGRAFSLRLSNESGSRFRVLGGLQLTFNHRLRT